jgi:DNA-binding LytR/AlgR family response regulator
MRCIIVDDDVMARKSLEILCHKIDDLEVVASCESGLQAMKILKEEAIDLILLDIEMPDLTGIDLVKSLDKLPHVIFVTSHTEYALEAFACHVNDYLVKPVLLPRFIEAIEHVKKKKAPQTYQPADEVLFVKVDGKLVKIAPQNINYIESIGDYVVFYTDKKERFIVHSTMKNIDAKLCNAVFQKVHRSYIVNIQKIVDIDENNLVIGDKIIPISRAHKPLLLSRIKTL